MALNLWEYNAMICFELIYSFSENLKNDELHLKDPLFQSAPHIVYELPD